MNSDIELALTSALDIAAQIETWHRKALRRRVNVSRHQVERWIRNHGLPATQVGRGPYTAAPSDVIAWCESQWGTNA